MHGLHEGRPLKVPTLRDHKIWIKVAVLGYFIDVSICFDICWAGKATLEILEAWVVPLISVSIPRYASVC